MSSIGHKFGFPVHKEPEGASEFVIPYAKVGIEVEVERVMDMPASPLLNFWDSHVDNSLRNAGREFTTKGGLIGKDLVLAVNNLVTYLQKQEYSVGYPRAGIHLHIDMTDMNEDNNTEFLNCVLAYMLYEKAVFGFAGEWREACGFCDPLSLSQRDFPYIAEFLYNWEKAGPLSDRRFSKYQAINFLPLQKFGTLEFRQLPTTFDKQRILDWINICLSFKQFGKKFNTDPVTFLEHRGLDSLNEAVFGKALPCILQFIKHKDVTSAISDVRALKIGKNNNSFIDSWDLPDNPLLEMKKTAKKATPGIEEAPVAPVMPPARVRPAPNRAAEQERARRINRIVREAAAAPNNAAQRADLADWVVADLDFERIVGRAPRPNEEF